MNTTFAQVVVRKWLLWIIPLACIGLANAQPLPSGDAVMKRVLERSEARVAETNTPVWAYDKHTLTEKLDGNGKVESQSERVFHVRVIQGVPVAQLVKVEGRNLTDAELKKENQNDAAFRKRYSGRDPKQSVANRESLIDTNLAGRFQFTTLRRELIQGRQTLVIAFKAQPAKGRNSIPDQILNRLAGTLWVDDATADVAKLDVNLTKEVSLGALGMLATIKECRMNIASKPMLDGTWLPEKTDLSIGARVFLSNIRFRMRETAENYALEPAQPEPLKMELARATASRFSAKIQNRSSETLVLDTRLFNPVTLVELRDASNNLVPTPPSALQPLESADLLTLKPRQSFEFEFALDQLKAEKPPLPYTVQCVYDSTRGEYPPSMNVWKGRFESNPVRQEKGAE